MAAKRVRDTRSGKFVRKGEAKRRPATTVTERRRVGVTERIVRRLVALARSMASKPPAPRCKCQLCKDRHEAKAIVEAIGQ